MPRVVDRACGLASLEPWRRRACAGLAGDVIEIGFGSGLNVPFYPAEVTSVTAVEPSDLAWRLATSRLTDNSAPVRRSGLDGQSLPFGDSTFDSALSTWTMCSIPDVEAALRELHRVLRPGGTLHFLEHGLAPDAAVARWQRRLEPLQKRIAGGCHLTRSILDLVHGAGFTPQTVDSFYLEGTPKSLGAISLGRAVPR